ncbi:MAG: DNA repair protein RecO C-terminal domain-containing protein [Moraxella sp.]|nr:DNA repair protein RecO C-terminal domain-containing protein [Moraxella sp.]
MRQEPLTGYVLHARPYQEKRAIYQYFSQEFGMVHGVGGRGVPAFVLVSLFASGQTALKSFSQITIVNQNTVCHRGQGQYALLYMNEVLCKLLAPENPCPELWHSYQDAVAALLALGVVGVADAQKNRQLRLILRHFERELFAELGVGIYFVNNKGDELADDVCYEFVADTGFVPSDKVMSYNGTALKAMAQAEHHPALYEQYAKEFGQIQRTMMDYLLDYKPLHSRTLWQQNLKYQS